MPLFDHNYMYEMQTGLPEVLTYDIIFNLSNSSLDRGLFQLLI
jgi:hypothetical protein